MPDSTYARFPALFLVLFIAVVLPGVAFEGDQNLHTEHAPVDGGQTVIIPLQEPCPPGTSTTQAAPLRVPRNASE